jgi:hypothetical protein
VTLRLGRDRRLAEVHLHQPLAIGAAVLPEVQHHALALGGGFLDVFAQVEQRFAEPRRRLLRERAARREDQTDRP